MNWDDAELVECPLQTKTLRQTIHFSPPSDIIAHMIEQQKVTFFITTTQNAPLPGLKKINNRDTSDAVSPNLDPSFEFFHK